MVFKFIVLFFTLMLLILGIYKASDMEYTLEKYAEEFAPMQIIGGCFVFIGFIIGIVTTFAHAHGTPAQISAAMIIGGFTMFAEPFVHYWVYKDKNK